MNRRPRARHVVYGVCVGFRRIPKDAFVCYRVGGIGTRSIAGRRATLEDVAPNVLIGSRRGFVFIEMPPVKWLSARSWRVTVGRVGKVVSGGQLYCLSGNYINIAALPERVNPFVRLSNSA